MRARRAERKLTTEMSPEMIESFRLKDRPELRGLTAVLRNPDTIPDDAEERSNEGEGEGSRAAQHAPSADPAPQPAIGQPGHAPRAPREDAASVTLPPRQDADGSQFDGLQSKNNGRFTEMTFMLEQEQIDEIRRLAALEQIRLKRNVRSSEVGRWLVAHSLAHVKGDIVINVGDGRGLSLSPNRED